MASPFLIIYYIIISHDFIGKNLLFKNSYSSITSTNAIDDSSILL
jgi:hypothetical protein